MNRAVNNGFFWLAKVTQYRLATPAHLAGQTGGPEYNLREPTDH